MKSILLSIKPKYVELIARGEKTIEVRKSAPQEVPFKAYIYCTKGQELWGDGTGATWRGIAEDEDLDNVFKLNPTLARLNSRVIGEFICDKVDEWECKNRLEILESFPHWRASYMFFVDDLEKTCLTYDDLWDYGKGNPLYGLHISDLKIYDKPRNLSEFGKVGFGHEVPLKRPPQSWMYIEDLGEEK